MLLKAIRYLVMRMSIHIIHSAMVLAFTGLFVCDLCSRDSCHNEYKSMLSIVLLIAGVCTWVQIYEKKIYVTNAAGQRA